MLPFRCYLILGVLQKQSLWVQWVNRVKLKGKSIWDIEAGDNDSWGWKKLLELRNVIKPYVFHKIGNGKNIFVWYDKWNQKGPLSKFISTRDIHAARFNENDKVADLIEEGRWQWPNDWYNKFPMLKEIEAPKLNDSIDKAVWSSNNGVFKEFSIKEVWRDLRKPHPKISWPSIEVPCILESTRCDCTHVCLISIPDWPWGEFGKICLVQWEEARKVQIVGVCSLFSDALPSILFVRVYGLEM
ncbi:hypothetical protein Tco_0115608 [Tanacetum coccineum]